jgi:enoyl-CoA hydratase/carnithine racemase
LRAGLVEAIRTRLAHELAEQRMLFKTKDFVEGIAAVKGRRPGNWTAS